MVIYLINLPQLRGYIQLYLTRNLNNLEFQLVKFHYIWNKQSLLFWCWDWINVA